MAKTRAEVSENDKWNVEALYPALDAWKKEFESAFQAHQTLRWPAICDYKGRLNESPEILKKALDLVFEIDRRLSRLYTYAHLRHDEDIADDSHKIGYNQILSLLYGFKQETAWFEPELLSIPDVEMKKLLDSPVLKDYRFHIEKIIRIKKHMLPPEQEELMALAGKALQSTQKAFSAINDADFKFGKIKDGKGQEHDLTHATYGLYVRDRDRILRENAFKAMHGKFQHYENTLTELLNGQVENHLFNAKARHYQSSLEAALFPKNIDVQVYHALIQAVHAKLSAHHKYIHLREKVLKIGPLHLYDMHVPLTQDIDIKMPYKEAEETIIEAMAPLGPEYQNLLRKGLKDERWVDRYENLNKRSGAYSSGCYDSMPYILMNYKELLRDVFTLAHEAGHSMHSLLSHKNQPYHYSDYPIFLAEVASTFNEDLLTHLLLKKAKTKQEKIFLINQKIEDIRSTLFRQTMFAEFELKIHEFAEKNIPLTPKLLRDEYRKLNALYFGENVEIDMEAESEWSRIPHFYYNFYVFQYATGISAALALSDRVTKGGVKEREDYLNFLKSGCSRYPIDILLNAGVDMRTEKPVLAAIDKFEGLVNELELLLTN